MQDYREKLQKLLNKLLRAGRCWCEPFGMAHIISVRIRGNMWIEFTDRDGQQYSRELRELVSMESQLRQFVCKHHFVQGVNRWTLNARQRSIYDKFITSEKEYRPYTDYQYWLIESSLVEEKDLAKFLLDNIRPGAQNQ